MVIYGEYYADLSKGGVVIDSNEDFLTVSGYTRQDIKDGKLNLFEFVPAEYRDKYTSLVDDALTEGTSAYIQHPFVKKNGTVIYVLCFGTMLPVPDDHIAKVVITDYTEHFNLISKYNSSQTELDLLTSTVPGGVVILSVDDNDLIVFKSNEEFNKLFGLKEDITGQSVSACISYEYFNVLYKKIVIAIRDDKPLMYDFKSSDGNGGYRWLRIYGNLYRYSYGKPLFYSVIMDITEDVRLTSELKIQTEKFRIIAENTEELYFDYDAAIDKMQLTTDLSRYELDGDNCIIDYWGNNCPSKFIHKDDYNTYRREWERMMESPRRGSFEFRTNAYDDDYTWYNMTYVSLEDDQNRISRVFGKIVCIQHLKTLKTKIDNDSEYIAYLQETDSLTKLLNRKTFKFKAGAMISSMDKDYTYGIVYSDINDFSYVNENFGYEAGNAMLKDFGRLITDIPTNLLGCRIYSDFFISLYRAKSREELIKSIEERNIRFTDMQKQKYPASDIHVSCGIYIIPDSHCDITVAIDNANLARRSVKSNSTVLCGIYSQRMRTQRAYEQSICSEIHSAIENRKIEMFLQPKFHLITREIVGAEALARWRNFDGSYKMPYEFIPVLEKVGYIDELDFFIYEEVLRTLERWKRDGVSTVPISVNFSQHHILHPKFVDTIIETADKYDVDKSLIEIEITESSFSGDMSELFNDLDRLRSSGFKTSIDDFGIGYSTLSVLMKAPVDIVKIDKSFIDNIERNKIERDFIFNMCKLIGVTEKDIIFEGVETEEQAEILSGIGYTKAQGWLFDKAIPLDKFNKKYMYKKMYI